MTLKLIIYTRKIVFGDYNSKISKKQEQTKVTGKLIDSIYTRIEPKN